MEICKRFTGYEKMEDGCFLIHTDAADLKICFVTDEILRVRASFDRVFPEASYVLDTVAWEDRLDPLFPERKHVEPVKPEVKDDSLFFGLETKQMHLEIEKDPLTIRVYDGDGHLLYHDLAGRALIRDRNGRVCHYSRMAEDDCFYGFGEKCGPLNKNKRFLRERATDAMGYDPENTDTLYKHIPFYIQLHRDSKQAVGLFYHNFYESVFNMGCEKSNYWPRYTYWQADGGDIDLFFIGGGTIKEIIDNYTLLTGRPALLPKRAFGYQGSSMYYAELEKDSDDAVLDFVDTVKAEGFPIDGFHLSSGYTAYMDEQGESRRCVFCWNNDRFKNPAGFFHEMQDRNAQVVPNVKPGILLCHPDFQAFLDADVFVKDSQDPQKYAVGSWWGGEGAFWDFTDPKARQIWKNYLTRCVLSMGTDSVWNDNCEYDSIVDQDAVVSYDGQGGTLAGQKPMMSNLMCRLGNEAVREQDPGRRPYTVCRSGSAGIQKYAQTWCGDNRTGWDTLKYNIPTITGIGLSGQPNEGADIGGFAGPAPEEELFVRWVQQGIFQARFSIHSASDDNTVTEPWMYSRVKDLIRDAMLFRYRLLPHLYSLEYEASQNGAPIMRALVYEFQNDPKVYDESFEYLFGRDILVANVLEPGAVTKQVYLPAGTKWYDWCNDFACYEGGQTIEIPVTLSSIPMFLREGAIVPSADNQPMSMEHDPVTGLHLTMVPGRDGSYTLYDDDGVTDAYQDGVYRKTKIRMTGTSVVEVDFQSEGTYEDFVEDVVVEMVQKEKSPYWVTLDGDELPHFLNRKKWENANAGWYYSQSRRAVLVKYPNPKKDTALVVSFEEFDLIGM